MKKKRRKTKTFHRKKDQRITLIKGLVRSLFEHERIKTTEAKAKEARKLAERLITKGKKDDLAARRYVAQYITDKKLLKKIFDEIVPRYKDRNGGYTRIYKLGPRKSDGAEMAIIELIK
ncbi:50S ribosomal protein L17 [bacterium]|nr:50S ribosomal protein L17 [bacterium]